MLRVLAQEKYRGQQFIKSNAPVVAMGFLVALEESLEHVSRVKVLDEAQLLKALHRTLFCNLVMNGVEPQMLEGKSKIIPLLTQQMSNCGTPKHSPDFKIIYRPLKLPFARPPALSHSYG